MGLYKEVGDEGELYIRILSKLVTYFSSKFAFISEVVL
jgi:hypothetical protein